MFISTFDLFKPGIGPSSSHTLGPMVAAREFMNRIRKEITGGRILREGCRVSCVLRGSLSYTGRGHATDRGVLLGLHGFRAEDLSGEDVETLTKKLAREKLNPAEGIWLAFDPERDLVFDPGPPLPEHPNGMIFVLRDPDGHSLLTETCFSLGGGFIATRTSGGKLVPGNPREEAPVPFPFDSAALMLDMAGESGLSIAEMKISNECVSKTRTDVEKGLDRIWEAMRTCLEKGLQSDGILPGGLQVPRRAKSLLEQIRSGDGCLEVSDWLCAYAMAVNEENAAGHAVVTAPTNGAAGVIPAILAFLEIHRGASPEQIRVFLLTAAAIGGLIKTRSSISGAEVGCQGEVGAAASMGAAGLCAVLGGTPGQVENAAEIALEHHLGMTCDPVRGLVQIPCIERNGMGAVKAWTAAHLALRGNGKHLMSLDNCIAAMRETGLAMSDIYKETSRGGLAVHFTEC